MENKKLEIVSTPISQLKPSEYNPKKMTKKQEADITESIKRFDLVDPIIANSFPGRENIIIGGHQRYKIMKKLGYKKIPVVFVSFNEKQEKELNLRLHKNQAEFDLDLLKNFEQELLLDVGFESQELDEIFTMDDTPEIFDLEKELKKLNIESIDVKEGDIYELNGSRLMCGDSTKESDVIKLMNGKKAVLCCTDPPYILDYLRGRRHSSPTDGFGQKKNRRYIGTDSLPDNFAELWMANINKVQHENFSIIVYENWKNIRTIWNEMDKYWKVKNMIVWHLPNRSQGFASTYKFFSKYDIAMVGTSEDEKKLNKETEVEIFQNEYESALYAISGKPHWEGYEKGKKIQPTDFIEYKASDEKSSGQGIIFGTKPIEILIPYIKVLTKQKDLIIEPFGGSGSTLIAATKMNRRCYIMEKCSIYAQVILSRWEKLTGLKPVKINDMSLNQKEVKRKIIGKLQNNPIIGHACKNAGVARSTFYRFREEDNDFDRAVKEAQRIGRAVTCDAAESRILNLINSDSDETSLKAAKTILNTYNHRYQNNNMGINYQKATLRNEIEKIKQEKNEILDDYTKLFQLAMDSTKKEDEADEEEKLKQLKTALNRLLEKIESVGKDNNKDNQEKDLRGLI